jgi:hypothetical protein
MQGRSQLSGGNDKTALKSALSEGHKVIVNFCLVQALISIPTSNFAAALQVILCRGHGCIVTLLLNAGADTNTQG